MMKFTYTPWDGAPANAKRLHAHTPRLDTSDDSYTVDAVNFVTEEEANLVTSATGQGDWHLPVLDLDIPHKLEPSSTPGHSHLYLDVPVRWADYKKLLHLLADMGIIERGYADSSIAKGATMVRKPGVTKPVIDAGWSDDALTRRQGGPFFVGERVIVMEQGRHRGGARYVGRSGVVTAPVGLHMDDETNVEFDDGTQQWFETRVLERTPF